MPAYFPERIVCLTEETTETLYLLGEERRIVGISGYTVRPARARREKPKVSAFLSAKIDTIVELEPDLVIGFSDLQADIARELAKAGLGVMMPRVWMKPLTSARSLPWSIMPNQRVKRPMIDMLMLSRTLLMATMPKPWRSRGR